ncbi:ABC-type uncharacterized transport system fused permease/ATPase subunit [Cerasibacillus quisquiliarum]|jgi:hypothetical protein|uniref:DUF2975 domain-containing protein n=3 Tax=Bacillaceae TaxID=186817 RepID=A0A8J2X961_9BACI|nr:MULTISPECIES: hypothetical protein [Bacillaceae]MBB5147576.1 ABC-type uncharacterized transport system fused permease/ATPase subunit [Cerasibacillus quisquiliarum]WAA12644.1 hypothetical protein OE105_00415 [Fervidibacillus halotolerans]GEN32464.1 hypothetical protein CQU01_27020 [Cerasibacillus quisquiliarum]GFZ78754.1 hypothetical protein GCM10010978_20180 [Compostibacillus humi]
MSNRTKDRSAEVFGMTVSIILAIVVFIIMVSVPIFLNFGVIYLLSKLPIVEFYFYIDFWSNFWFFFGFTVMNIIVLVLSELLITAIRRKKIKKLSDIGPINLKEWIIYLLIFIGYINLFDIYFDRFNTTFIGAVLISVSIIFLFIIIEKTLDMFQDEEEGSANIDKI